MVALAVREILPDVEVVYRIENSCPKEALIRYRIPDKYRAILHPNYPPFIFIKLPSEVRRRMIEFDGQAIYVGEMGTDYRSELLKARQSIKPFEFEIRIPDVLINMIGISQVYKILSESSTLELAGNYETI